MKILHICNDLFGSRVHVNLYGALADRGVEQAIFVVRRQDDQEGEIPLPPSVPLVKAKVVKPIHRFLYHVKRRTVFKSLRRHVDVSSFDMMHASTLFSDGGVAFKANLRYHIPYVVTVRNTDVNGFLRFLPHTWLSGWRILLHAQRIAFVSKAIQERFEQSWVIRPILSRIKDKFVLQLNGLDDFWCDHVRSEVTINHKVLYVGDFSNNKNVKRLLEALLKLRQEPCFSDATLTLVGGGRVESEDLPHLIETNNEAVRYVGPVKDKERLCEIYREHSIFAMPSIHETFGLAYVEALSQNLAILYTKGQGVDGIFDRRAGEGVHAQSTQDIEAALKRMMAHRDDYSNESIDFEPFRWRRIADCYQTLYEACLNSKD